MVAIKEQNMFSRMKIYNFLYNKFNYVVQVNIEGNYHNGSMFNDIATIFHKI